MDEQILVIGKNGQLGKSLQRLSVEYPQYSFCFVGRAELNLSKPDMMESYFNQKNFDFVINCAAYTAVDKAESEPEMANQVNHLAVKQLAEVCKEKDINLIHISTDYVFSGKGFQPYVETDNTDPQNIYGITKLAGELAMLHANPNGMIIRTSWVYSEFGNNFVKTMISLGSEKANISVVFDQIGSPTYAGDLAKAILKIISHPGKSQKSPINRVGIYHYSNEGVCSWYDFAIAIFELCSIACQVMPIETKYYPTPAKRPNYTLLSKSEVKKAFEISIPHWRESLTVCLKEF